MDSNLLKSIMGNKLMLDFPQMKLIPHVLNSLNKEHEGSGFIKQNQDGTISLKMYCKGNVSPVEAFYQTKATAGKIYDESYFYSILAWDIYGREWESKWLMPDFKFGPAESGYVIDATVREVKYSAKLAQEMKAYYAGIYFSGEIEIPSNTRTKIDKIINGQKRAAEVNFNIAKFTSSNFEFEVEKETDWLALNVISDAGAIKYETAMRFNEALQFVLARTLSWSALELIEGRTRTVRIKSCYRNKKQANNNPPLHFQNFDYQNRVWKLFDKFLCHVVNYENDTWPAIFNWIHAVIESSNSSVDTQALILCVAVEGVLKDEFCSLSADISQLKTQIDKTKKIIKESDLQPDFKKRLNGMFSAMLQPRAKDNLHILKQKKIIRTKLIKEYDKLRNSSAHGEVADISKLQEHIDRCDAVLTLFYNLIFLAINYTGEYTDYSEHGFPTKKFDATLGTPVLSTTSRTHRG